jgi:hypothetical protein
MRRRDAAFGLALLGFGSALRAARPAHPQTSGERTVGVAPVHTQFPAGDVRRHGALGDGSVEPHEMHAALKRAWTVALFEGSDIHIPSGIYDVGATNLPWRQPGSPDKLLDCKNIVITGEGRNTVLKTTSDNGADVFQLNGLKNFHVRNLAVTAVLTGRSHSGSNGISITGGFDNISILDVWCTNLPSIDKGAYIDGGRALTVQIAASGMPVGRLHARIFAKGCTEGFGYETVLDTKLVRDAMPDVELVAEDCHTAFKFVALAASGPLSSDLTSGLRIRGKAINCMRDVAINRLHGGLVDMRVVTSRNADERRRNPSGVLWQSSDTVVEALLCTYSKNAVLRVHGDKGACDYKARIGGIAAGASGLNGATEFCQICLDLKGEATRGDVADASDSRGRTMGNSSLCVSTATAKAFPAAFSAQGAANALTIGRCPHGV